jgi:POT family proton-dependent oligopeptide transporter
MSTHRHRTAPDPNITGYPPGIAYIIGNEGCERFSFYGMRAILYVYVVALYIGMRGLDEEAAKSGATATVHLFNAAVYALPIIGAIVADRLLGKYRTILWLSMVYCLGHLALAVFENPVWQHEVFGRVLVDPVQGLYIGLGLIAVGSGGIKPCVSAHVGDQFGRGNWHKLEKIYNAFYFIINFGSAFATIFIPLILGERVVDPVTGIPHFSGSASWAFGVPGILMGLATFSFWLGRKEFVHVPAHPGGRLGLLDVAAGSALFMGLFGYPVFLSDLTSLPVTIAICLSLVAVFALLFGYRQKLALDDGFLTQTMLSIWAKLTQAKLPPGGPPEPGAPDLRDHFFYGPAARRFGNAAAEGPIAVWRIISVFFLVSVFWALFDQHSSTWIEQAQQLDRLVAFDLGGWLAVGAGLGVLVGLAIRLSAQKGGPARALGLPLGLAIGLGVGYAAFHFGPTYELQASQVPAVNPFMVMILIPLTTFGLYPLLGRLGFEPRPLRRMTLGMLTAGFAFVAVAFLQIRIDAIADTGAKVHVGWQLIPYFIITLAEVMVSITGLEFAYSQAPKKMKSVIMGFWLLNVTIGNLLVALLAGFKGLPLVTFFFVFAGLMMVAGLLFGLRASFYKYRDYTQ